MSDCLNSDDRIGPQHINLSATTTVYGTDRFLVALVVTVTRGLVIRGYT
jgi:hypothetical protein